MVKLFYDKCLKMAECNSHETDNIYPNLNEQEFRLNKINEIKDYFVAEIKERELMSKRLSNYIASFDYFDKSLIVLSVTTGSISIASFTAVIGAPGASGILSFFRNRKKVVKATRNKKKKHNKFVMRARSKLNSIESKISEAMINNEISHEDFTTIINEEKKHRELKESIRKMNSQIKKYRELKESIRMIKSSDLEKINLIEEDKKICINEVIKRNEIINNSFKTIN